MNFRPLKTLTDKQVTYGLRYIVKEGAAAEAMSTLTGGTFLVAMAVMLKAIKLPDRLPCGAAYTYKRFSISRDLAGATI